MRSLASVVVTVIYDNIASHLIPLACNTSSVTWIISSLCSSSSLVSVSCDSHWYNQTISITPPPIELWCRFSKNAMYGCIIGKVKYFKTIYST